MFYYHMFSYCAILGGYFLLSTTTLFQLHPSLFSLSPSQRSLRWHLFKIWRVSYALMIEVFGRGECRSK